MAMDKHNIIKLDAKFSKIAPLSPFDRQASRKRIRNVFLDAKNAEESQKIIKGDGNG